MTRRAQGLQCAGAGAGTGTGTGAAADARPEVVQPAGFLPTLLDASTMQITLSEAHPQVLPPHVAANTDVQAVFGQGRQQVEPCCLCALAPHACHVRAGSSPPCPALCVWC